MPRYEHDCDGCTFLGQDGDCDVWHCPNKDELILRRSSKDSNYSAIEVHIARQIQGQWVAGLVLLDAKYPDQTKQLRTEAIAAGLIIS